MKLDNLQQLFHDQLRDLYDAENRLVDALPKMAKASHSPELKAAFTSHLKETEGHVARLERIFETIKESPRGKTCKAMKGLIAEGEEAIEEDADPHVKDAALIAAAQRVEHYEMAGYGTVRTYAQSLKESDLAKILQETLDEEGAADKKLTAIAEKLVNPKAR